MLIVNPNNRLKTTLAAIEPPLWAGLIADYHDADILDAECEGLSLYETEVRVRVSGHKDVIIVVMGNNPSVSSTPKMVVAEALADSIKDLNVSLTGIHPIAVGSKYPVIKQPFDGFPNMPVDKLPMGEYRAHNWHCLDGSPRSPYASIYTSIGCPFNCIAEGELISMTDGTLKPISQIRVGDKVLALNEKGEIVSNLVLTSIQTAKSRDIITIKTTKNELSCTPDHKVLTKTGWVEAGCLKVGDYVTEVDRQTEVSTQSEVERDTEVSDCCRTQQDCSISEHGSTGTQTIKNAIKQSDEIAGSQGKSISITQGTKRGTTPTYAGTLGNWKDKTSHNVSGGAEKTESSDEAEQSYEEQTDSPKGSDASALAAINKSKECNREMDKARGWSKQDRSEIRDYSRSNGISLCGGWEVLDRSMPEWEVQKPRLYLEKWTQQDRDSLQFNILAQSIALQRLRGVDRLSEYGMAHICHHRTNDEEFERVDLPDSGMAQWSKITSIEKGGSAAVYDLETYPNHNFIAGNLVVHNCYYCNIHTLYGGRSIQLRPIPDILREVDTLVTKYKVRNIKFWDELFTLKEDRVISICDGLKDYDLNMWAYARLDTITGQMLKAMKRGGINWVAYGFENVTDKKFVSRTEDVIKMTDNAGINIIANFMFGLPGTTKDDDKRSVDFAMKYLFEFVNFYDAKPYPGSQWFNDTKPEIGWGTFSQWSNKSEFRRQAFQDYFTNPDYLSKITKKWGKQAEQQIKEMLAW